MSRWFESAHDLVQDAEVLHRRRYGVIEVREDQLIGIWLRPWPKWISLPESTVLGRGFHRRREGNHCWLYYNQPRGHSSYLTLKYVLSARDTTLSTFRGALTVLDEIARIKGSDALLCDASNLRISDRLLARWGWEPHLASRWHRHHIKRFYGDYPPPSGLAARVLAPLTSESPAEENLCGDMGQAAETGLVARGGSPYDPAASAGTPCAPSLS